MNNSKEAIIGTVMKDHHHALGKATGVANACRTANDEGRSWLYMDQAYEEEAKARGYLNHAEILAGMDISRFSSDGQAFSVRQTGASPNFI